MRSLSFVVMLVLLSTAFAVSFPYWVEKDYNANAYSQIWTKVNLTSSSPTNFYVYYGGTTDKSNGSAVFEFFDDLTDGYTLNADLGGQNGWVDIYNRLGFKILDMNDTQYYAGGLDSYATGNPAYKKVFSNMQGVMVEWYWKYSSVTAAINDNFYFEESSSGNNPVYVYKSGNTYYWYDGTGHPFANTSSDTYNWIGFLFNSTTQVDYFYNRQYKTTGGTWQSGSPDTFRMQFPSTSVGGKVLKYIIARKFDGSASISISYGSEETGSWSVNGETYTKRRLITVTSSKTLTDYQIALNYSYFNDTKIEVNNNDVVTGGATKAVLNYWHEKDYNLNQTVLTWVKTNLSNSPQNWIYVYYGGTEDLSNGSAVFDWFDDFTENYTVNQTLGGQNGWTYTGTTECLYIRDHGDGKYYAAAGSNYVDCSSYSYYKPIPEMTGKLVEWYMRVPNPPAGGNLTFYNFRYSSTDILRTRRGINVYSLQNSSTNYVSFGSWTDSNYRHIGVKILNTTHAEYYFERNYNQTNTLRSNNDPALQKDFWMIFYSQGSAYNFAIEYILYRKYDRNANITITYGNEETGSWTKGGRTYTKRRKLTVSSNMDLTDYQIAFNYSYFNDPNMYVERVYSLYSLRNETHPNNLNETQKGRYWSRMEIYDPDIIPNVTAVLHWGNASIPAVSYFLIENGSYYYDFEVNLSAPFVDNNTDVQFYWEYTIHFSDSSTTTETTSNQTTTIHPYYNESIISAYWYNGNRTFEQNNTLIYSINLSTPFEKGNVAYSLQYNETCYNHYYNGTENAQNCSTSLIGDNLYTPALHLFETDLLYTYLNGTYTTTLSEDYFNTTKTFTLAIPKKEDHYLQFYNTSKTGTYLLINYTAKDEETKSSLTGVSAGLNYYATLNDGFQKNYSLSESGTNFYVYVYPQWGNFTLDSFEVFEKTGYVGRNRFMRNVNVTNNQTSMQGTIYLLQTSSATDVVFSVKNNGVTMSNVFIDIMRYYTSTNTYEVVATAKIPDGSTTDIEKVDTTAWYKFRVYNNNGEILFQSNEAAQINCVSNPCTYTIEISQNISTAKFPSLDLGCEGNKTANLVRCHYTDGTGKTKSIRFLIKKNTQTICEQTVASSSAEYVCVLNGSANLSIDVISYYIFYSQSPEALGTSGFIDLRDVQSIVHDTWIILPLFVVVALAGFWHPSVMLVLGGIAFFLISALGLFNIPLSVAATVLIGSLVAAWYISR